MEENKQKGFVKLYRSLLDWEWYQDANTMRVFMHCLLKANYKDKRWQGIVIPKGSFVSSRGKLAQELHLSEQNVRTALNHLKSTGEITIKSTKKYTIYTVNNWDYFQEDNQLPNQPLTNNQPTANQQLTTTKEVKKEKKEKKERKTSGDGGFLISFDSLKNKYSAEVAESYVAYHDHWAKKPTIEEQTRWIQQLDLCGSNEERLAAIRYSSGMNPSGSWYRGIYADSVNKASTYGPPEEPNLPEWYSELPAEKATKKEIDAVIALQKAVAAGDAEAAERIQATILGEEINEHSNPIN